jgi:hypothetical protein
MIDVSQQINAVRRQVGTRVLEAGEARTVTISHSYDAAVEDGRRFMALASQRWCDASIAAGADEAEARAAAGRTIAAYIGADS